MQPRSNLVDVLLLKQIPVLLLTFIVFPATEMPGKTLMAVTKIR